MIILLLFLLQQTQLPTVGDTLWATRSVRLASGDSVRPAAWDLSGPVQLLGRPVVTIHGNQAEIRYPLVAWEPGNHALDIPGPIITHPSGVEDTLAVESLTLAVGSVLPRGVPDSELSVQPPASLVNRGYRSILPVLVLGLFAGILLVPLHWWWGRRGEPIPLARPVDDAGPPDDMVRRWADAGERRVVASTAAVRLRSAIARQIPTAHVALDTAACLAEIERHHPEWPRAELERTLMELDSLRFAPSRHDNAYDLYQRGIQLEQTLSGAAG
jgi:hypothetical protein